MVSELINGGDSLKNRISLLSFEEQPFSAQAEKGYEQIFSGSAGEELHFERYSDIREMFSALAEAFSISDIAVLAVPEHSYIQIKKLLFAALKTRTEVNSQLAEKLGGEDSDMAVMPADAEVLPASDGRFAGFIESCGKQTLIFLTLSDSCFEQSEEKLKAFLGGEAQPQGAEEPVQTGTNIEETEFSSDGGRSDAEKCDPEKTAALLRERKMTVAVATSKSSPFIFSVLPQEEEYNFNDVIFSQAVSSKRGENESHKEYLARTAGIARTQSGADLGVSISNVFLSPDKKDEFFLLMCVADKDNARLFKIYSKPGENTQEFIYACVHRLFALLGEYANGNGFIVRDPYDQSIIVINKQSEDGAAPTYEQEPQTVRSGKKTALIVIILVLIAALLGTAVTFLVKAYGGNKYTKSNAGVSVSDVSDSDPDSFMDGLGEIIFADVEISDSETDEQQDDTSESGAATSSKESTTLGYSTTIDRITDAATVLTTTAVAAPTTTRVHSQTTTGEKVTEHTTAASAKTGTFVFTVYGYGHGVGMSQNGASEYARRGWDYKKILLHYYYASGMSIVRDSASNLPSTVKYNGKSYTLTEYLGKTAYAEVGPSAPLESIKAQIVAIYTYAKRQGFNMNSNNHAFREGYNGTSSSIENAIKATLGDYLSYNGSPAFTPYFSTSAGVTTSSANAWGSAYPYLAGGRTSPESDIVRTLKISSEEIRSKVEKYNASVSASERITLQDNPAQWIKILEHDSALSSSVGYISSLRIGDKTMRGNAFRLKIMGASALRSHCFTFTYIPD